MSDDLTAALDEIRQRGDWASDRYAEVTTIRESAADVPRLLAALDKVLERHTRQNKPVRSWDQMCLAHAYTRGTRSFGSFKDVAACPDCRYTEFYVCLHCECPNDRWPCPTVQAITRVLMPIRSAG